MSIHKFQKEKGNYVGELQLGATYGVPYVSDSEEEEKFDNATAVSSCNMFSIKAPASFF